MKELARNIYFTADLHLGHHNVLKHDNRPWTCINQHDEDITNNFIEKMPKGSLLYILGDLAWSKPPFDKFMAKMKEHSINCYLIRGNHDDRVAWKHKDQFVKAYESRYLHLKKKSETIKALHLSHYPHRSWRGSHYGTPHLYGHVHGNIPEKGMSADVGVMVRDYKPVSLLEVEAIMAKKEIELEM